MPSIESFATPLVYRVHWPQAPPHDAHGDHAEQIAFRTEFRALDGMQKEAAVTQVSPGGFTWRMVSDEGPYLEGGDLAPYPLAFFTAGVQFCLMSRILDLARAAAIEIASLTIAQTNRYSMVGSFLRGDARGGAAPPEVLVTLHAAASSDALASLIQGAVAASPAHALLGLPMRNTFGLQLNRREIPVTDLSQASARHVRDPLPLLDSLHPDRPDAFLSDIITKVKDAERRYGVEGGISTSLQPEQKRTLHLTGDATWLGGSLMEAVVGMSQPLGSTWRFVSDADTAPGARQAPPPLAYVSAAIGFCYLTQLTRYAKIAGQHLDGVRLVQDTGFVQPDAEPAAPSPARADGVETHVYLEGARTNETAQELVRVGEQTCFLHAAMRGSYPAVIRADVHEGPVEPADQAAQGP